MTQATLLYTRDQLLRKSITQQSNKKFREAKRLEIRAHNGYDLALLMLACDHKKIIKPPTSIVLRYGAKIKCKICGAYLN